MKYKERKSRGMITEPCGTPYYSCFFSPSQGYNIFTVRSKSQMPVFGQLNKYVVTVFCFVL